tara:strand:- start:7802 stop:8296 length:495 start_codon:yes stop_codon:yes gene_type:complete
VNSNSFSGQIIILLVVSFVFSLGFNAIRSDGIPLIASKQIIKGGQSVADSLLSESTFLFEPIMIDLSIAKEFYDKDILFIDARDEKEFKEAHIKGAKLAPAILGEVLKWTSSEYDPIVTYCGGGQCDLSMSVARELMSENWGFNRVFVFEGGLPEWIAAKYPVE